MSLRFEEKHINTDTKIMPLIAVTMATSRQGIGVVKELSQSNKFRIRAITRNLSSKKAKYLSKLKNVKIIQGDLLDRESLNRAFDEVDIIFGNTTPTKGWTIIRGSIVRDYEIQQGQNLINEVKIAHDKGRLNHFIFSSICKTKNPLKNDPAPGHFTSKWDIEEYIKLNNMSSITTILRPASYFENFENIIPGNILSKSIFPGIIQSNYKWQTIAVNDIGKWVRGILSKSEKYKNKCINIATEELTGFEMAKILEDLLSKEGVKTSYFMLPRFIIKLIESDIGIMADWIERAGYGADMNKLKEIEIELDIKPTSLKTWLSKKLIIEKQFNKDNSLNKGLKYNWISSMFNI